MNSKAAQQVAIPGRLIGLAASSILAFLFSCRPVSPTESVSWEGRLMDVLPVDQAYKVAIKPSAVEGHLSSHDLESIQYYLGRLPIRPMRVLQVTSGLIDGMPAVTVFVARYEIYLVRKPDGTWHLDGSARLIADTFQPVQRAADDCP